MASVSTLGPLSAAVAGRLAQAERDEVASRLWKKDGSLWSAEPAGQAIARNRLGWLDAVPAMRAQCVRLAGFAEEIRRGGFRHAFVLGMGGSSLAARTFREVFGHGERWLDVRVLDTTHPDAIREAVHGVDLRRAFFLVSSKSGTTAETLALHAHFARLAPDGRQYVAITDAGRLVTIAAERGFRRTFLNAADIGGRYSALSYFGLLPACLQGLSLPRLVDAADRMASACAAAVRVAENPGAWLGAVLAEAALAGRDKLTLVLDPRLASLGGWIEQLVAESSGKQGRGIVPVDGEPLGAPAFYGDDRLFVHVTLAGEARDVEARRLENLEHAGHPVVRIELTDPQDVAGEFFRWEMATALACSFLGVNAFDEPDVQSAKEATAELLARFAAERTLPEPKPLADDAGLRCWADAALSEDARASGEPTVRGVLARHLQRVRPRDYVAVLAFLAPSTSTSAELTRLRVALRDRLRVATTVGCGPRYLHSTGQLHKGGPDTGVFLVVTAGGVEDLEIPGSPHGFGTLLAAQALGDFTSLEARGRRVVRCHLSSAAELPALVSAVEAALAS